MEIPLHNPSSNNDKRMESPNYSIHESAVYAKKMCTTFRWMLQDYSALEEYYAAGIKSPPFDIADTNKKCRLTFLHTNEQRVFVNVSFPHSVQFHTLKIDISIIDEFDRPVKSIREIVSKPLPATDSPSYSTIFTSSLINAPNILTTKGCLSNDTLTILCKITVIKSVINGLVDTVTRVSHETVEVRNKFADFFDKQLLCDVVLLVNGKEFHGHKIILAANSSVFEAMFDSEAKESLGDSVRIDDVEADIFEAFLKYIYTGSVANMEQNVRNLLLFANKYKVYSLRKTCDDYINLHLRCANCIEYLVFAHSNELGNLKENAMAIAIMSGRDIADLQDFHNLCNYPELMSEIFRKISGRNQL